MDQPARPHVHASKNARTYFCDFANNNNAVSIRTDAAVFMHRSTAVGGGGAEKEKDIFTEQMQGTCGGL